MNIQDWSPLGWTGWISLQSKGLSSLLQHIFQLSHPYMTTGKTIALTIWTFVGKEMSLLFNMLYRFVIVFLSKSKLLLIPWLQYHPQWFSVQFSSVAQSCQTLYDPMNCSTPGLPVHHQLLQITQTHIRWVSDAIQPSHPRSSPSPPAPNPSQHQSLFQWVNSLHQVAKVLEFQL